MKFSARFISSRLSRTAGFDPNAGAAGSGNNGGNNSGSNGNDDGVVDADYEVVDN